MLDKILKSFTVLIAISFFVPGIVTAQNTPEKATQLSEHIIAEYAIDQTWSYDGFDVSRIIVGEVDTGITSTNSEIDLLITDISFRRAVLDESISDQFSNQNIVPLRAIVKIQQAHVLGEGYAERFNSYLALFHKDENVIRMYDYILPVDVFQASLNGSLLLQSSKLEEYDDSYWPYDPVWFAYEYYTLNVKDLTIEYGFNLNQLTDDDVLLEKLNQHRPLRLFNRADNKLYLDTGEHEYFLIENENSIISVPPQEFDKEYNNIFIYSQVSNDLWEERQIESISEISDELILGKVGSRVYLENKTPNEITKIGYTIDSSSPFFLDKKLVMWPGVDNNYYVASFEPTELVSTGLLDIPKRDAFKFRSSSTIYGMARSGDKDIRVKYCHADIFLELGGKFENISIVEDGVPFDAPTTCSVGDFPFRSFTVGDSSTVYRFEYNDNGGRFKSYCNAEEYIEERDDPTFKRVIHLPAGSIDFERPSQCG